jgi:hypothetical protein
MLGAKELEGTYSPDGSVYVCNTDGNGNLNRGETMSAGGTKGYGLFAPDGSWYVTISDGQGTLL